MEENEYKQRTVAWYERRLAEYGPGITALSSGTEERRKIRFDVLAGVGIEPGVSVLDVGCGLADFYDYLLDKGCQVAYSGVDLVPELVEQARHRHPDLDVSVRDIQADPLAAQSFDFVVCSQTFNLCFDKGESDNQRMVEDMMRRMLAVARKGVAIDFVSDYVDFKDSYLIYRSPEQLFRFAKSLTKRVSLRHDYPLYEFCLYLYPDFEPWGKEGG